MGTAIPDVNVGPNRNQRVGSIPCFGLVKWIGSST